MNALLKQVPIFCQDEHTYLVLRKWRRVLRWCFAYILCSFIYILLSDTCMFRPDRTHLFFYLKKCLNYHSARDPTELLLQV